MNTEFLITLVHGTFAKGAAWTGEGSVLRQTLKEELNGKVDFSVFEWSGRNSQRERLQAGLQLKDHLSAVKAKHPGAAHFIVAHSHGGNVALVALAAMSDSITGLVCLATPFLRFRARRISLMLLLVLLGLLAPPFFLLAVGFNSARSSGTIRDYLKYAVILVIFALVNVVANRWLRRWIWNKQASAAGLYPIPGEGSWRLFGVSLIYDEARLLLRMLWLMAELPFLLWNRYICLAAGLLCLAVVISAGNEGTIPSITRDGPLNFFSFLITASLLSLCAASLPLLLGQVLMFLSVFVRGHPAGYGWEGVTTSWLGCVSASEKPPLAPQRFDLLHPKCCLPAVASSKQHTKWSLRHSRPYGSPQSVREIARWIMNEVSRMKAGA